MGLPGYSIAGPIEFISSAPASMEVDQTFVITNGGTGAKVTFHGPPGGSIQLGVAGVLEPVHNFL